MVFKKLGDDELDAVVNVRLTSSEKERLKLDADIAGLSMSALVRARYFGRPIVAHADLVTIRQLNRLTAMLKTASTESGGACSADTAAAIAEISETIKAIAASKKPVASKR